LKIGGLGDELPLKNGWTMVRSTPLKFNSSLLKSYRFSKGSRIVLPSKNFQVIFVGFLGKKIIWVLPQTLVHGGFYEG